MICYGDRNTVRQGETFKIAWLIVLLCLKASEHRAEEARFSCHVRNMEWIFFDVVQNVCLFPRIGWKRQSPYVGFIQVRFIMIIT